MAPNPPRRKVLIIEDEPSIRNVLYVLLAGIGCDGDAAYDTHMALSMIRQDRFDAVLLDLRTAQPPTNGLRDYRTPTQPGGTCPGDHRRSF